MKARQIITAALLEKTFRKGGIAVLSEVMLIFSMPSSHVLSLLRSRSEELKALDSKGARAADIWLDLRRMFLKLGNIERERLREQCEVWVKENCRFKLKRS